jgi:hypothetical protein
MGWWGHFCRLRTALATGRYLDPIRSAPFTRFRVTTPDNDRNADLFDMRGRGRYHGWFAANGDLRGEGSGRQARRANRTEQLSRARPRNSDCCSQSPNCCQARRATTGTSTAACFEFSLTGRESGTEHRADDFPDTATFW